MTKNSGSISGKAKLDRYRNALASVALLAGGTAASVEVIAGGVIGQVTTQGTAIIGTGVSAIDVNNGVYPYFSGQPITVEDESEVLLRLTDDGALRALAGTNLRAALHDGMLVATAEGNGILFQFKASTAFDMKIGCFTVTSLTTASSDSDQWVSGAVLRDENGLYAESASGEFAVVASGQTVNLAAGMRSNNCGADLASAADQPAQLTGDAQKSSLDGMSWIWGAGAAVAAVAPRFGGDSATSVTASSGASFTTTPTATKPNTVAAIAVETTTREFPESDGLSFEAQESSEAGAFKKRKKPKHAKRDKNRHNKADKKKKHRGKGISEPVAAAASPTKGKK